MNSIKLIMMSIMLNLLLALGAMTGNYTENTLGNFLNGYQNTIEGYSSYVSTLKASDSILASSFGSFLNAVEGIVNIVVFVVFFIGLFFSAIIAIPGALTATGLSFLERVLGLFATLILVINNVVLVKEVYSLIINRKVED